MGTEQNVLGFVVWVAELEHEVGDELFQQEIGEDCSEIKAVYCNSCLLESHVEVAIDVAIEYYVVHSKNDRLMLKRIKWIFIILWL